MKKKVVLMIISLTLLCSCSETTDISINESLSLNEQTITQLQLENVNINSDFMPINYENQKAVWFTMMDLEKALNGKSMEAFTDDISSVLEKIKDMGFNTVYVHVRPYNDAYYKSEIFPPSKAMPEDYDPLKIIVEKSHELNLSVHGWINPLRCQTETEIQKLDEKYQVKKWQSLPDEDYISLYDGRYYLNPAYEQVREYISEGVLELLKNYSIDGVHIDDYFYPTTNEDFDKISFKKSGESDLKKWRTENINLMVKGIYDTIKNYNADIVFGISPQGNISINNENLYADVRKWCSESGYCDYIVPQLYYGFKNESLPFKNAFNQWADMVSCVDVNLVAGICTYKIGNEDKWAGSGKAEWIEDENIPSRQIEYAFENDCDVAVYSYESLFDEKNKEEKDLIENILKEEE